MQPMLRHGQIVVVRKKVKKLSKGDIVMIGKNGRELIKRVADVANNQVYVLGDNSTASTDSRTFGWVEMSDVVGKV